MVTNSTRNSRGGVYVCGKYHQSGQCQRNGKNRVEPLEDLVLGELRRLCQEPQLVEKLRRQQQQRQHRDLERELAAHRQEWERFPQRKQRMLLAWERGVLSLEELTERKQAWEEEKLRLGQVIHQMEQQLAHRRERQRTLGAAQEALQTFDQHFEDLPRPTQKQLLRHLVEKIDIRQQEVNIHYRFS